MRSERGFTLVELIVSLAIGMTIVLGVLALVDVSMSNSARVAARVDANQRARPVLQRLIDELHSACLGPDSSPVLVGSGSNTIGFLHRTGSAVSPIPDKRVVTLAGETLSESVYPVTGGTAPNWTFASTPSSTRQLLTGVGPASAGDPPSNVPLFQYFADQGGQLGTPLPTPLSATDAGRAVHVTISFSVAPRTNPTRDEGAPISVSDSVYLRFSPFSEDPTKVNGPCA
jgi:type II secretory pathway pseudopilin PulG